MDTLATYQQLCETEGSAIPLFQQYWWMNSVCHGKHWDVAFAYDSQRNIIGAMPYLWGSKLGLRYIIQPQLTQFCGPWYRYPSNPISENHRLQFETDAATQFIEHFKQLHPVLFQQNFSPSITNWLPFHWAGYRQTTRYTYRLNDISQPQQLFESFSRNERQRRILKLQEQTHTVSLTPDDFADFQNHCRDLTHQHNLVPRDLIVRLSTQAITRDQGLILGLETDTDSQLIAAIFAPFDDRCAYFLIPAVLEPFRKQGAMETLVWMLIQQLSGRTKSLDFEGSMDKGIEQFYRSFGAVQTPYFSISKCPIYLPI